MPQRNLVAGAILLVLGICYGILTAALPDRGLPNTPGPAFFPWLITLALIVLSAALLVQGYLGVRGDSASVSPVAQGSRMTQRSPSGSGLALGGFVVYLALLPAVGFLAASLPFFAGLMWLYGERSPVRIALAATVIPLFLFYLFTAGFQILLPRGPLSSLASGLFSGLVGGS